MTRAVWSASCLPLELISLHQITKGLENLDGWAELVTQKPTERAIRHSAAGERELALHSAAEMK